MLRIILLCFALTFTSIIKAQPSFTVRFTFSLFDDQNNLIDKAAFSKHYKFLNEYLMDAPLCPAENYCEIYYDQSSTSFAYNGTIVYNDLIVYLTYKTDTMKFVLPTGGGGTQSFHIDKLVFKKGKYVISQKNNSTLNLRIAEVNYYNYILTRVIQLKSQYLDYKRTDSYIELMTLKSKYRIKENDYEEKGMKILKKKSYE